MKSQTTNENTDSIRFLRKMNSNTWRPLVIAVLMLLITVSYASAQIGLTICTQDGGNYCPSPQYRYGAAGHGPNAGLTGNPVGDKRVLNSTTVSQLVLLTNTGASMGGCQSPATSGTFPPVPSPSSSPSIESRIIFPALDKSGLFCDLFTYDLLNPGTPRLGRV
jgi:hypothetical protein